MSQDTDYGFGSEGDFHNISEDEWDRMDVANSLLPSTPSKASAQANTVTETPSAHFQALGLGTPVTSSSSSASQSREPESPTPNRVHSSNCYQPEAYHADVRQNLATKFLAVAEAASPNRLSPGTFSSKRKAPEGGSDTFFSPPNAKLRRSQSTKQEKAAEEPDVFGTPASQPAAGPSHQNATFESDPLQLKLNIIAHCAEVQKLMDSEKIAWGVQYELARGVSRKAWGWGDVTAEKLQRLKGINFEAAPKVAEVMLEQTFKSSSKDMMIWSELDREQLSIAMHENHIRKRGLGLCGTFCGEENWYGGRIVQAARLVKDTKTSPFYIQLEPLTYQSVSTRFARFLGSRRILRLGVPSSSSSEQSVRRYLTQKFVLCGRVFRPLKSKDGKVFLVEVREDYERLARKSEGDGYRMSFEEIIEWHNPREKNADQPLRKWISRFDLGLSTTVPVLEFRPEDINCIDDQYSPDYQPAQGKASAEQILTDGCGFMNLAALAAIARHMKYEHMPTAVQGRIAGAKGLWILNPEHQTDSLQTPKIWIRTSQNKIKLDHSHPCRAHLIFELLGPDYLTFPSRLSKQTIINLSENNVPSDVFMRLMEDGIKVDFEQLTAWKGDNSTKLLIHTVSKVGNVGGIRRQREVLGLGRALGYGREKEKDSITEPLTAEDDEVFPTGRARFSLEPYALGEKIYEMLVAGFHPFKSSFLNVDMRSFIKNAMSHYIQSYHIPNSKSCEAFIIPDPFGVLREDEIYFRSWQCIKDAQTETSPETLTGPVLINRNPTRLPSDVQRVTAMDDAEYRAVFQNYRNVIICSTQGNRSFASKLAGGDYDGDTAMLTWAPEIVSAFVPPEFTEAPRGFMETHFEKDIETVAAFRNRLSSMPQALAEVEFHQSFLFGLSDSNVWKYSKYHDNAVYRYGYKDAETIRLAYMFNSVLDSSKTGVRVVPAVLTVDGRKHGTATPGCMQKPNAPPEIGLFPTTRPPRLGNFVLDELHKRGEEMISEKLVEYESNLKPLEFGFGVRDEDITGVFSRAEEVENPPSLANELDVIKKHVDRAYKAYKAAIGVLASPSKAPSSPSKLSSFRRDGRKAIERVCRDYDRDPEGVVLFKAYGDVEGLKASYAFRLSEKFAFTVAFRKICEIKASSAARKIAPVSDEFGDALAIPASFAKLWAQSQSGR